MFLYFDVSLLSQGGGGALSLPKNVQSSICKRKGVSARLSWYLSKSHSGGGHPFPDARLQSTAVS